MAALARWQEIQRENQDKRLKEAGVVVTRVDSEVLPEDSESEEGS